MTTKGDPYQPPLADGDLEESEPFAEWTTGRMVALFFLPWIFIFIIQIGEFSGLSSVKFFGLVASIGSALIIAIFSARVFQLRQNERWPSFLLMAFIYLLAQTVSIFLVSFFLAIVVTNFPF